MKNFLSILRQHTYPSVVAVLVLATSTAKVAGLDAIPYAPAGTLNPANYVFVATTTGNITAYFAGANAGYISQIGMLVNGISTGIYGLQNDTAAIGQSLILGSVNAGDIITFELKNLSVGLSAYSDPSLNGPYDAAGGGSGVGQQHIYSTAYTGSPAIDSIPAGTYVGFEDIYIPGNAQTFPDFDYNDETFIFANISTRTTSVPDSTSSLALLSIGFAGIGLLRRRVRT